MKNLCKICSYPTKDHVEDCPTHAPGEQQERNFRDASAEATNLIHRFLRDKRSSKKNLVAALRRAWWVSVADSTEEVYWDKLRRIPWYVNDREYLRQELIQRALKGD